MADRHAILPYKLSYCSECIVMAVASREGHEGASRGRSAAIDRSSSVLQAPRCIDRPVCWAAATAKPSHCGPDYNHTQSADAAAEPRCGAVA